MTTEALTTSWFCTAGDLSFEKTSATQPETVLRLDPKVAHAYVESLAVGGETGTLERRGMDGRVRAKTGFIAGTSALSGLVETRAGRTLVFSILVDYPKFDGLNTSCWKPMQDAICKQLASWDSD